MSPRVLVVEDDPFTAGLLCEILDSAGFAVSHANNAAAGRRMCDEQAPDAVLVDVHLGHGPSGVHLGHSLRRSYPRLPLIFLSRFSDPVKLGFGSLALPSGSRFMAKDRVSPTLLMRVLSESLSASGMPSESDAASRSGLLTETQLEVLRMAAMGYTNADIARARNTSERNVEQRLRAAYIALDVPTDGSVNRRVEAIRRFVKYQGLPTQADIA